MVLPRSKSSASRKSGGRSRAIASKDSVTQNTPSSSSSVNQARGSIRNGSKVQPTSYDRPDFGVDAPFADQFRSSLISFTGSAEQVQKRRVLERQEELRKAGIIYVEYLNEYFVKVHLQPEPIGPGKKTANARGQRYRICYPFAPSWVKEVSVQCLRAQNTENPGPVVYELPLSSPFFRDGLRWFVKHLEQEIEPECAEDSS